MNDVIKLLLVRLIRLLLTNTRVAKLVVVIVKIVGDAGLRIGKVSENGPVLSSEYLGFEA